MCSSQNNNTNNVVSVHMVNPVVDDEPKPKAALNNCCPSTPAEKEAVFSPQWYHCVYPRKPATRSDPIMMKLLDQVKELSEAEFEGENCLEKISGRSPWKLSILASGDQLCAFIVYKFVNDRRAFSVGKLAVPKAMRGRGLGTFVMKWVKESCKANPNVDIVTLSSLPAAIKLYKKIGFKKIYTITQSDPDEELVEGQVYMEMNWGKSIGRRSIISAHMATAVLPQECPRESLVRYDPPQDVGEAPEPPVNPEEDELKFLGIEASDPDKAIADAIAAQLTESAELPPMDSKPTTEDVLHILLPPREWAENGRHILQHVNNQPSTRLDVIQLQEALDEKLMERQARETGICPVREELYGQCFDELIRQVTLDCPERGLLLLRIRNEIRMTIAAYQTLYHSSVVFGTRKQIQSEEGKDEAEQKLQELREKRRTLATKLAELERRCEAIERRESERNNIDERKRKEEIDFLKHQGQHLQTFLEGLEK
ncbi:Dynein, axonemal, light intermediate chain 1 [Perkinsus olseni]|uniref:Dynein, axonemal, light intermediate chain 1 n=1 Tax=Perkinsus olseni TaxID=32597 RepID=A0A7J6R1X8_PEROL|nr:Dynein, axonemal, light intermediate chain 1 [Perkinsus olseni]